jgi:hypothetical protein
VNVPGYQAPFSFLSYAVGAQIHELQRKIIEVETRFKQQVIVTITVPFSPYLYI